MPKWTWDSETIVDDLSDVACFRHLLLKEVRAIAAETGHTFKTDAILDDAITRCASRYRQMLQLRPGQQGIGADGPISAVKAMYRLFNETFIDPKFRKKRRPGSINAFDVRLLAISSRGLVAHNFCLRFLQMVGWRYFDNKPFDDEALEFNALTEVAVRNFENEMEYSFIQMYTRVFRGHAPKRLR
jgi:hypothetical protein